SRIHRRGKSPAHLKTPSPVGARLCFLARDNEARGGPDQCHVPSDERTPCRPASTPHRSPPCVRRHPLCPKRGCSAGHTKHRTALGEQFQKRATPFQEAFPRLRFASHRIDNPPPRSRRQSR